MIVGDGRGDMRVRVREDLGAILREMILASRSPRRARILIDMGIAFRVMIPEVQELDAGLVPQQLVRENAVRKWSWCSQRAAEARIIAADTVVEIEGRILGKPRDRAEAAAMLRLQAGREQQVHTGYVMGCPAEGQEQILEGVETSAVVFRTLSQRQIDAYLDAVQPYDRAGAYDIDENGGALVASFRGSRTNVMGLPAERVQVWMASSLER